MAITISASQDAAAGTPLSARLSTPQVWGILMIVPYLLVFLAFVVYPVGYGFWLARQPSSYVAQRSTR
jgi:multiple sugar transport system permease protein